MKICIFGKNNIQSMTNEDFYFDKELNYKILHINYHPTHSHGAIILPFTVIILCKKGSAKLQFNLETYNLEQDSILCMHPNTTLKPLEMSGDAECMVLTFAQDAVIDSTIGFRVEYLGNIFANPYKKLDDECEKQIIYNLFNTLDYYSKLEQRFERNTDFVYGIIRNIIITVAEFAKKESGFSAFSGNTYTTTDNYFRTFMKLLSEHSKTQHNVAFYADKLCITPKYLNEICRKKTKKTAKEVITRNVIAQIKNALIVSGTSVQRIAYDFNFCDQSSFGKYFKKAVGVAPMAFRNKHSQLSEDD